MRSSYTRERAVARAIVFLQPAPSNVGSFESAELNMKAIVPLNGYRVAHGDPPSRLDREACSQRGVMSSTRLSDMRST